MRRRLTLVALLLVLAAELPLLIPPPFGLTDHLVFWKAGQLAATGASPYDMSLWAEARWTYGSGHLAPFIDSARAVWIYPAWTAFLFVPWGLLPFPAGPWALHIAYVAIGLVATVLFIRALPPRRSRAADTAIVLAAMFQPLVIGDRYGQFGSFLLLGIVFLYLGLERQRTLPLIIGALLLFTKPQLFVILAPAVLWLLIRRHAWRPIGLVGAALLTVAVVTTLRYPESLAFFGGGVSERVGTYFSWYSSTWAFALQVAGSWWLPVALALIGLTMATTIAAVRRLPADLQLAGVVSGACVLSLAITPVDLHYDHVSLVPAIVLAVAVGRRPDQILATWVVAVVVPWLAFFTALNIGGPDAQWLSGIVPILFGPLLLFATAHAQRAGSSASSTSMTGMPSRTG